MTINYTPSAQTDVGNDATTDWGFDFILGAASELKVLKTELATGGETEITASEYDLTLNVNMTGSIKYPKAGSPDDPLSPEFSITRYRVTPENQATKFGGHGKFKPEDHERAFDRVYRILHELTEKISRAVLVGIGSGTDPANLITTITNAAASSAASAAAAAAAEVNAETAETNAEAARDLALQYRNEAQAAVGGVKVTGADTTARTLNDKLTVSGPLAKAVGTPGGDETLGLSIQNDSLTMQYQAKRIKTGVRLSLYSNAR